MRKPQSPIWGLATFLLLVAALVVAISHGRVIEAVIIGVLAAPAAVYVVGSFISRTPCPCAAPVFRMTPDG
jgi:galactitol-specific phosphotransferase system IIC component